MPETFTVDERRRGCAIPCAPHVIDLDAIDRRRTLRVPGGGGTAGCLGMNSSAMVITPSGPRSSATSA